MSPSRELHLNVNLLGGLGLHPGAWRVPDADALSFQHIDTYVDAARTAERGLLDAVFLADSPGLVQDLAVGPPYNGIEPTLLLTAIALLVLTGCSLKSTPASDKLADLPNHAA